MFSDFDFLNCTFDPSDCLFNRVDPTILDSLMQSDVSSEPVYPLADLLDEAKDIIEERYLIWSLID